MKNWDLEQRNVFLSSILNAQKVVMFDEQRDGEVIQSVMFLEDDLLSMDEMNLKLYELEKLLNTLH